MSAVRTIRVLGQAAPLARIVAGLAAGGLEVLDASLKDGVVELEVRRRTWAPLPSGVVLEIPMERWGAMTEEEQAVERSVNEGLAAVGITALGVDRGWDRASLALLENHSSFLLKEQGAPDA